MRQYADLVCTMNDSWSSVWEWVSLKVRTVLIGPAFLRLTFALYASEQLPYLYSFWPFDQFHSETDGSKMGVFALEKAFLTEDTLRNTKFNGRPA